MGVFVLSTVPHETFSVDRDTVHTEMFPNVGLSSIGAFLKGKGKDALLCDPAVEGQSCEGFAQEIAALRPAILGLSCYTIDIDNAGTLARMVKKLAPEVRVVAGGYHPSALPEKTLEQYPALDAVVFGEGEITSLELLEAVESGRDWSGIQGLAYRDGGGSIVKNPDRPQIPDLDTLPYPSFEGLPLPMYRKMYAWNIGGTLPISASRGCPYTCTFCYRSHGTRMRYRSPASVVGEMECHVRKFGIRHIIFTDETFTVHKKHTAEMCEAMIASGLPGKVRWMCETRVDAVSRELLFLMKKAGCSLISFGVESGSQEALDHSQKRITLEQTRQAFAWCAEAGILTGANFIIGHPHDTQQSILATIAFAREIQATYAQFAIMTPFPGTEIATMAQLPESRIVLLSEDWRTYGKQIGASLELKGLNRRALEQLQRKAYRTFYLRPSRVRRLLEIVDLWTLIKYGAFTAKCTLQDWWAPAQSPSLPTVTSQAWNGGLQLQD